MSAIIGCYSASPQPRAECPSCSLIAEPGGPQEFRWPSPPTVSVKRGYRRSFFKLPALLGHTAPPQLAKVFSSSARPLVDLRSKSLLQSREPPGDCLHGFSPANSNVIHPLDGEAGGTFVSVTGDRPEIVAAFSRTNRSISCTLKRYGISQRFITVQPAKPSSSRTLRQMSRCA